MCFWNSLAFAMVTHSSTLAWKIPWMEEPGRLRSMGSRRVGHDWATSLSLFTFMHWEGNGNPLQCSFLENPRDGRAWWAAVYGFTLSRTQLKRLSNDPADVGNLISCSSAFPKTSLNNWKFTIHMLLKPGLENFEHSGLTFPSLFYF